jgi:predicted nucleic acid-binding protein
MKNRLVLDASVVATAFFPEEHSPVARKLLSAPHDFAAPDLLYAETANVIWKRHGKGELDAAEARAMVEDLLTLPIRIVPARDLVTPALELALRTRRTVYDCLYLALAVESKAVLVTGDRKFANALAATPLAKHIAWIGDLEGGDG